MTEQFSRAYWEERLSGLSLERGHFIDGKVQPAASGRTFVRTRPMDGQPGAVLARGDATDVDHAVACARKAFASGVWRSKEPLEKKTIMLRWAELKGVKARALRLVGYDEDDEETLGEPATA